MNVASLEIEEAKRQRHILADVSTFKGKVPYFKDKLSQAGFGDLKPVGIGVLQVNVGKKCNQTCKHCHVNAGPHRKEVMTRETMEHCLRAVEKNKIPVVDITGGAPEMNRDFRWFVESCYQLGVKIIVRCNLTIIVAGSRYLDLPEFYAARKVELACSLPFYNSARTDKVRGRGVFDHSIKALKKLNAVGYGKPGSGLTLDMVYNPAGAFMPASQDLLEKEFKTNLKNEYDIVFNRLWSIANLPVSRFLDYLLKSENYNDYMETLVNAFNPAAAEGVMCRDMISVGYDGHLYDCDFNQMLEMKIENGGHISQFNKESLMQRSIQVSQHCYGCTAGSGSSCGGATA